MKKLFLGILIGSFITGGVSAAVLYSAKDISFSSTNEEFNATNVEDAIIELYKVNNGIINENKLVAAGSYSGCADNIYIPNSVTNNYYMSTNDNNIVVNKAGNYKIYEGTDGSRYENIYSNADFYINNKLIFNITTNQYGGVYAAGKYYNTYLKEGDILSFVGHAKSGVFCTSLNYHIIYLD